MDIKTLDIVSGPQGIAAMIKLPDRITNWYQEENVAPHVTFMVAENFEPRDLVKKAVEVREWKLTENPYLHT